MNRYFQECSLIIREEVPMQHQHCPKAIDRILRDIHRDDRPFGRLTIVFGGDFHKNFAIIVKGSKGQIIASSFQRSSLWHNFEVATKHVFTWSFIRKSTICELVT